MLGLRRRRRLLIALLPFAAACGPHLKTPSLPIASTQSGKTFAAAVAPASVPTPVQDPVVALIAASDGHFKSGQHELAQGHFEAAKVEFNRAVDVLIESPYGARTEPRIREHFDRLVDRISAYEVKALAEGDGFAEKKYEVASIDALLALTTRCV